LTRGPLRIAGFRVVGTFPETAGTCSVRDGTVTSLLPRARASRAEALDARRVPASSAVGGAFRSRPARCRAPSTGISKNAPPSTSPIGVHTRGLAPASVRSHPTPYAFRPRRSSRPRRLPPPMGPRACCIPQPTLGFTGLPHLATACPRPDRRFPSGACPPELFPPEKRYPRHREPLPPCRSPDARPVRLRGLVPLGNPSRR